MDTDKTFERLDYDLIVKPLIARKVELENVNYADTKNDKKQYIEMVFEYHNKECVLINDERQTWVQQYSRHELSLRDGKTMLHSYATIQQFYDIAKVFCGDVDNIPLEDFETLFDNDEFVNKLNSNFTKKCLNYVEKQECKKGDNTPISRNITFKSVDGTKEVSFKGCDDHLAVEEVRVNYIDSLEDYYFPTR